jgi:hypothetical protein
MRKLNAQSNWLTSLELGPAFRLSIETGLAMLAQATSGLKAIGSQARSSPPPL